MPSLQKKLTGRNIVKVALTPAKIIALSSSGKVYVLSSTSQPTPQSTTSWLLSYLWNSPQGVDHVELKPNSSLGWREKVQDIQAGQSHILALTSSGRCFSSPLDLKANDAGQLGVRQVDVPKLGQTVLYPAGFAPNDAFTSASRRTQTSMEIAQAKALPRSWLPDHLKNQIDASEEAERTAEIAEVAARVARDQHADTERDIRFCSQLYEIPALKDLNIAQIACGERHNLVRTHKGRVLAFGSNSCIVSPLSSIFFPFLADRSELQADNLASANSSHSLSSQPPLRSHSARTSLKTARSLALTLLLAATPLTLPLSASSLIGRASASSTAAATVSMVDSATGCGSTRLHRSRSKLSVAC